MIRIAIVSPLQAVRLGLRMMLSGPSSGASSLVPDGDSPIVVYESANLGDMDMLGDDVDLLIIAVDSLPLAELGRMASQQEGHLSVLLLTQDSPAARQLSTLPLRSWGVLTLETSVEELAAAVRALYEGLLVGTPALVGPILVHTLAKESGSQEEQSQSLESLTERESEVLQLLAMGLANKQIAASLGISEHTVKFHVSSIYARLNATNRTDAVRLGIQRGLILL